MCQALIGPVELGFVIFSICLGLFAMILSNSGLEFIIDLLFNDLAFIEVVLVGSMDGTPLSTIRAQDFAVPGVAQLTPFNCSYSRVWTFVLVTWITLLPRILRGLGIVLAWLRVFCVCLSFTILRRFVSQL